MRIVDPLLYEAIRRPNPNVITKVELSIPNDSDILQMPTDWTGAALVSLSPASSIQADPVYGTLTLEQSTDNLVDYISGGWSFGTDISGQQVTDSRLKAFGWQVDPAFPQTQLQEFSIQVSSLTGASLTRLQLQIYKVEQLQSAVTYTSAGEIQTRLYTQLAFTPLLSPAPVLSIADLEDQGFSNASTGMNGTATFDIANYQLLVSGAAQETIAPTPGSTPGVGSSGELPVYYFVVSCIDLKYDSNGVIWDTSNASGSALTIPGVGSFAARWWSRTTPSSGADGDPEPIWAETVFTNTRACQLKVLQYANNATAVYVIDVGGVPPAGSTGRIIFNANQPAGTGLSLNYSTVGATGPWTPAVSQQELPAPYQTNYWLKLGMQSGFDRLVSPSVYQLGVEFRTAYDQSYEADPTFADKSLDLPYLASSVGQLQFDIIRTGARDYHDIPTFLTSTVAPTSIEADVYIGSNHPQIGRDKWLHLERQTVVDRQPFLGKERFNTLSYSSKLLTMIPLQQESISITCTVRAGTPPNNTTAGQIFVDSGTPLSGTPYNGLNYYFKVVSSTSGIAPGYVQTIIGSVGTQIITLAPSMPVALNDGDIVQIHSGVFDITPLSYVDQDPATVWMDILLAANVPANRIGYAGIGNAGNSGLPPTVAQRAPGDPTTQALLLVSNQVGGGSAGQVTASSVIDQLSFIMGGATVEIAGQIVFVPVYPLLDPFGSVVLPTGSVVRTFTPQDYFNLDINIGLQKRIVYCQCAYGVNYVAANASSDAADLTIWVDEDALDWLTQQDLQQWGNGAIPDDIAAWCYNSTDTGLYLATQLARQVTMAFSNGMQVFDWNTAEAWPELTQGDTVCIVTDQYSNYNPSTQTSLSGWLSIPVTLISVAGGGRQFKGVLLGMNGITSFGNGGNAGTNSGANTSEPAVIPSITMSAESQDQISASLFSHAMGFAAFTPLTGDPNFLRLDVMVQAQGSSTVSTVTGSSASPIMIPGLAWGLQYTFTPIYVSTAGTRWPGTPVNFTPSAASAVIGRTLTFSDGGFAAMSSDNQGLTLTPQVVADDGAGGKGITKGTQILQVIQGASFTFMNPYQVTPIADVSPGNTKTTHEARSFWGTIAQVTAQIGNTSPFSASLGEVDISGTSSLTGVGGVAQALQSQPGTSYTTQTVSFPGTHVAQSGTSAGLSGGTNLPAYNNQYTVIVSGTVDCTILPGKTGTLNLPILVDISINSGSTWTNVGGFTITQSGITSSGSYTQSGSLTFTNGTLVASTTQFRFRVGTATVTGASGATIVGSGTFAVGTTAKWLTSSSTPQFASQTPNPTDFVNLRAYALQ